MNEQDHRRVPDPQRPREKQHGPGQRREREQPLRDLDELATIEAIGQGARVDREEQEGHPVADDGEPRERRRVERLEDHPVADHVLDVVGGRAEEYQGDVATVVTVVERPELRARRGPRGEERRSTHCGDYNPCSGGARRRPSRGWGPAGRGAAIKSGARRRPSRGWGPAGRGAAIKSGARRRPSRGWGPAGRGAAIKTRPVKRGSHMKGVTLPTETVFVMEASPIKFGLGATDEIAYDARRLGLRRVLIVTDRHIGELGLPDRVRALLEEEGIKADIYDGVEIEPTDRSMEEAAEYARQRELDGLIAVGGGSALDTCKAVNLLTTYPAPLLDYVNQPVGRGRPVPDPLKPLIAVPTTAGTGSETTAVAVTHVLDQHVKAGVSHRLLRPALGIVDPLNTLTAPAEVTAAAGADILTHAIESYTTRPYHARPKHHPPDRPAYIGANPASDIWCEKAIE